MATSRLQLLFLGMISILTVHQNSIAQTIMSTPTGGRWNSGGTWIGGVIPTSSYDVIIAGPVVYANGDGSCRNLMINAGASLYNGTGYNWPEQILTVNGNLTNNGIIRNGGSFGLALNVTGNITNNGQWVHNRTELSGNSNQTLTLGANKLFEAHFSVTDSVGFIVAGSDLAFTGGFNLNNVTLNMANFAITFVGSTASVSNGTVSNAKDIVGTPTSGAYYPMLDNITYDGSPNIRGRVQINSSVTLKGSVTITDTLENSSGYGHPEKKLQITGNLVNNGIIRNGGSFGLALNVTGNITNNGKWTFNRTELSSSGSQTLALASGKMFESSFKVTGTSVSVIASSDLWFTSSFDLGKLALDMKSFALTFVGSSANISNGNVLNAGDIVGKPTSGIFYPVLDNITYDGSPNIRGESRSISR